MKQLLANGKYPIDKKVQEYSEVFRDKCDTEDEYQGFVLENQIQNILGLTLSVKLPKGVGDGGNDFKIGEVKFDVKGKIYKNDTNIDHETDSWVVKMDDNWEQRSNMVICGEIDEQYFYIMGYITNLELNHLKYRVPKGEINKRTGLEPVKTNCIVVLKKNLLSIENLGIYTK